MRLLRRNTAVLRRNMRLLRRNTAVLRRNMRLLRRNTAVLRRNMRLLRRNTVVLHGNLKHSPRIAPLKFLYVHVSTAKYLMENSDLIATVGQAMVKIMVKTL